MAQTNVGWVESRHPMKTRWEMFGRYFGFPICCRREFARTAAAPFNEAHTKRAVYSAGTGFVPCAKHCLMIERGEVKLRDIIKNRVCELPFPAEPLQHDDVDAFIDELIVLFKSKRKRRK